MAMSNQWKGRALTKALTGDTIRMILMATAFVFDIDAHDGYANISANELANGNGYTTGGEIMAGFAVAVDDVNDRADATWSNVVWTASGGSIGPSPAAVIFDDTETTPIADICIGDIAFGSDQTATDGGTFTVSNPTVRLA
jgi:hypothetical protein